MLHVRLRQTTPVLMTSLTMQWRNWKWRNWQLDEYANYLTRVDWRASTRSVWMLPIFNISLIGRVDVRPSVWTGLKSPVGILYLDDGVCHGSSPPVSQNLKSNRHCACMLRGDLLDWCTVSREFNVHGLDSVDNVSLCQVLMDIGTFWTLTLERLHYYVLWRTW